MNRSIFFRSYVPEIRKMVDVFAVNPMNQTVYLSHLQLFGTEGDDVLMKFGDEPDHVKLMQYTGLQDENLVEVYEDDLWSFDNCLYLVLWTEKHAKFSLVAIALDNKHTGEILSLLSLRKGKVIGNIHQNPELLEARS